MKIDMFEHLANPLDEMKLETAYRLWRVMPYMSLLITDRIVDLLKEKNAWRQMLKQDINRAIACLRPGSDHLVLKLVKEEEGDDYVPLNFETAICEKFVSSFLSYYQRLIEVGAVAEEPDQQKRDALYKKYLVDRGQFMISLNKGDIFSFLDTGKYEEFTYNGFTTHNGETWCEYISYNEKEGPELFKCPNVYRPVLKMSI